MTLAAKARLRLSWLVAVRIAQAAWSQRQAASPMPLGTVDPAVAQGERAGGSARTDARGGHGTVAQGLGCRVVGLSAGAG